MPTVLVSEEPGEVPFDSISQDAPSLGLGFHLLPQRVGIISVHTEIATHIKCDIIAGSELFDLCISPWLLAPGSRNWLRGEARIRTRHSAYQGCRLMRYV